MVTVLYSLASTVLQDKRSIQAIIYILEAYIADTLLKPPSQRHTLSPPTSPSQTSIRFHICLKIFPIKCMFYLREIYIVMLWLTSLITATARALACKKLYLHLLLATVAIKSLLWSKFFFFFLHYKNIKIRSEKTLKRFIVKYFKNQVVITWLY